MGRRAAARQKLAPSMLLGERMEAMMAWFHRKVATAPAVVAAAPVPVAAAPAPVTVPAPTPWADAQKEQVAAMRLKNRKRAEEEARKVMNKIISEGEKEVASFLEESNQAFSGALRLWEAHLVHPSGGYGGQDPGHHSVFKVLASSEADALEKAKEIRDTDKDRYSGYTHAYGSFPHAPGYEGCKTSYAVPAE
jgi:hypothetical protein